MARAKTDHKVLSSPRRATFIFAAGQVFWLPENVPLHTFPGDGTQWRAAIKSGYSGGPAPVLHRLPYSPFRAPGQYSVSMVSIFEEGWVSQTGGTIPKMLEDHLMRYSNSYKNEIYLLNRLKGYMCHCSSKGKKPAS